MNIGLALRSARHDSAESLRTLAELAATSHSALAAYESNSKVPRADTLIRILEATGHCVVVMRKPAADIEARVARGKELEELLRFTSHFPTKRPAALRRVRFGTAA